MIILIAGDTHTGKTLLAQKLLEKYKYPYLSIDHLKMGLIRSKQCTLPADSSDMELTNYLWPIVREMIKTCIERLHFQDILDKESVIEKRLSTDITFEDVSRTNRYNLEQCISRGYRYVLIDKDYLINVDDI